MVNDLLKYTSPAIVTTGSCSLPSEWCMLDSLISMICIHVPNNQ